MKAVTNKIVNRWQRPDQCPLCLSTRKRNAPFSARRSIGSKTRPRAALIDRSALVPCPN